MFKALLVDDEAAILRMLAKVFEIDGFLVATANSAAKGTAMLAGEERFDTVITDLQMESTLAGFEVIKAAGQVVPRPLIVILTAFPVPATEWKEAGADALFVKGVNTLDLPKQLKTMLHRRAA
jgi:CheY-like chemotaxis protein